jgi:hypothetical protein
MLTHRLKPRGLGGGFCGANNIVETSTSSPKATFLRPMPLSSRGCFTSTIPDGNTVIKYFFPENRIAASVSATLLGKPSLFAITAIDDSTVLEYDFAGFRKLVSEFPGIAAFYIRYVEQHGIIKKEPDEVSFRHDDAMERYRDFIKKAPDLHKRLKQHHIAAWLAITPESLSRLRKAIAYGGPDSR